MSVARPLLRALLRAEAAWRRAAREAMQRSASATAAPLTSTSSSLDETSTSPAAALLRFREPMDTSAWQRGRHGWALGGPIYHCKAAKMALGSGGEGALPWGPITSGVFRGLQLRRLILRNFRAAEAAFKEGHALELSAAEDAGFAALRALGEQRAMERCSSDSVSANGIRVEATAALVAALPSSSSSRSSFVFGSSGSGPMRSVSSAGPGVIVITSVEGGSSDDDDDDDDEDEDSDEDEEDSDEDSGAARRVGLASASLSSSSAASSFAPEMRYVFTYRLRITNTNVSVAAANAAATAAAANAAAPPLSGEGGGEEERKEKSADGDSGEEEGAEEEEEAETETETGPTPGLRLQLLSRGWQIRDSHGKLHAAVPKGSPGVVGRTPVLEPGDTFEYYSSTDLPTPAGVMSGSFGMSVVGIGGGGSSSDASEDESNSSESGRDNKGRKKGERKAPPPLLPSTVASRRFEAVVAPFALRADPLKR